MDPMRIRHGHPKPGIYTRIVRSIFWERVGALAVWAGLAGVVVWMLLEAGQ